VLAKVDFCSAVLSLRRDVRSQSKAFVAHFRFCDSQTIHMARRQTHRAGQLDIKGIQIRAFAAYIA
jgi:hypothetical protein